VAALVQVYAAVRHSLIYCHCCVFIY